MIESITDGRNVEQREYTDNTGYKDEWVICEFDTSLLLAIDHTDGAQRHEYFEITKSNLQTQINDKISVRRQ